MADLFDRPICFNCRFASTRVYETITIDSTDYHCTLQNGKMIYSSLSLDDDFERCPDCPVGLFEKEL